MFSFYLYYDVVGDNMKLNQEFVLREIAGDYILIPIASADDVFNGVITLNDTGAFIWKQIEDGKNIEDIVNALQNEYEVTGEIAKRDIQKLCDNFKKLGIM